MEEEVHDCELYEDEPFTVECFALKENNGILAVARRADFGKGKGNGKDKRDDTRDCVVEFWNIIGTPVFHIKTAYLGKSSVEGIIWVSDTLVSAHVDGTLGLLKLHSPETAKTQLCPVPVWCLASIKGNLFCAGTDSGGVFICSLNNGRAEILRTVSTGLSSRIVSIASDGLLIAVGSTDQIDIINVSKKTVERTMKLPRDEKKKPTVVWCLVFDDQHLLVSGDSRGFVCFWDPLRSVLLQSVQSHGGDILTLCVSDDVVYAAGADPSIARFHRTVPSQRQSNRVINHVWRMHSNDIRALAACKSVVFSGGAEHGFYVSTMNKENIAKKLPSFCIAQEANFLVYQYSHHLIIWHMQANPIKLATINPPGFIIASSISADGEFLAIATNEDLTLYKTTLTDQDLMTKARYGVLKREMFGTKSVHLIHTEKYHASSVLFSGPFLFFTTESMKLHRVRVGQMLGVEVVDSLDGAGEVVRMSSSRHASGRLVMLTTKNEILITAPGDKVLRLDIAGIPRVLMDVRFWEGTCLFALCANVLEPVVEFSFDCAMPCTPTVLSRNLFTLSKGDLLLAMDSNKRGVVFTTAKSFLRILTAVDGRRAVLFNDEARARSPTRLDRCCAAAWIRDASLLVNVPSMVSEPSQGALTTKKYGAN